MTQPPVPPDSAVVGPCFFRSFASYEIPFRPTEPVAFADTEGQRSYYAAYFDPARRVVRFDKLRIVRATKKPHALPLTDATQPGSAIYFAVVTDPATGEPNPGERLDYRETEGRDEFFAGTVGPSGTDCQVTRVRREVAFSDTYSYWPNGRLRTRIKWAADQEPVSEHYDADGNRLNDPVAYAGEVVLDGIR